MVPNMLETPGPMLSCSLSVPMKRSEALATKVHPWAMVEVILSASACNLGAISSMAAMSSLGVSTPSVPIFLSSPTVTPKASASPRASRGACSKTERNSSPCSRPEANPWANCTTAALASVALAPEMRKAWLTAVTTVNICPSLAPMALAPMAIRAYSVEVASMDE